MAVEINGMICGIKEISRDLTNYTKNFLQMVQTLYSAGRQNLPFSQTSPSIVNILL